VSEPLLQVDNLESYYGPVLAIRGVSLEVPVGKIVSVLGANGAGKTTLLKTISGVMNPLTVYRLIKLLHAALFMCLKGARSFRCCR